MQGRTSGHIVNELGEVAAEGLIQLAAGTDGDLRSMRLQDDAPAAATASATVEQAERLSRLAWQVGLVSLAGVAVDVADCARRGDVVALEATLARMVRVADRSLTDIWEGLVPGLAAGGRLRGWVCDAMFSADKSARPR
jgi:hypothetical protein